MSFKFSFCSVALLFVLPKFTKSLQCYTGDQFSIKVPGSGPISRELTSTSCDGIKPQCLRVDFIGDVEELKDISYVVGQCAPNGDCSLKTCHQIKSRLRNQMRYQSFSYKFHSCKISCCSTNNCNSRGTPRSVEDFATTSLVPSIPSGMQCYSGLEFKINAPGAGPISSKFTTTLCSGLNNECLRVDYTVIVNGKRIPNALGRCIVKGSTECFAACHEIFSNTPEKPQFALASVEIESCISTCCSTSLCNAKSANDLRKQFDNASRRSDGAEVKPLEENYSIKDNMKHHHDRVSADATRSYQDDKRKLFDSFKNTYGGGSCSIVVYSCFAAFFYSIITLVAVSLIK